MDQLTGLPVLPEGYFWRVSHPFLPGHVVPDFGGYTYYRPQWPAVDVKKLQVKIVRRDVHERKVTRGRWRKRVETEIVTSDHIELTELCQGTAPVAVLNAANRAKRRFDQIRATKELVGDYPPKSLVVPGE